MTFGPRYRTRRGERGAAVFIVVLEITLLTAVGIFAARAASLVDMASGFNRQAMQTSQLVEYAGRFGVVELGAPTKASQYIRELRRDDPNKEVCPSNQNIDRNWLPTAVPCLKLDTQDIDKRIQENSSNGASVLELQSANAAGSLGPVLGDGAHSALEGSLLIELVEAYQAPRPPPGFTQNENSELIPMQLTLTAWAQVRSVAREESALTSPWCADASASTAASVQRIRAYVTAPIATRQ